MSSISPLDVGEFAGVDEIVDNKVSLATTRSAGSFAVLMAVVLEAPLITVCDVCRALNGVLRGDTVNESATRAVPSVQSTRVGNAMWHMAVLAVGYDLDTVPCPWSVSVLRR